jgi:hypothetical protein
MAQPNYSLLNTNIPAEAASSAMKGMQQVNALSAQRLENDAAQMAIDNALAEQAAYRRSGSLGEAQQNLLRGGLGKQAAALGQSIATQGKSLAETQKIGYEIDAKKMDIMRNRTKDLLGNPSNENFIAHIQEGLRDGLITPEQAQRSVQTYAAIPPNERVAYLTQQLARAEDIFNASSTPAIREYKFGKTDPGFTNYQMTKARAGATQVNMGGQPEFIKELGKGLGSEFTKEFTATSGSAQSAAENLPKLYDTLNLINTSDAITGIGSEVLKNVERVKAQFLADKNAGKKVSDTEVLDAMLGSDVFPMIQSLGVGARGMDTPAEREFLRGVMTGTTALDKDTLKRMTEIRINLAKRAIEKYNRNVESGKYKPVETAQGSQLPRINAPEFTGGAAPVFARNEKTGERIQSTDGGKTWTPVGAR